MGWILHDIMSQIAPEKFQQIGFNYGESSLDSDFTSEDYTWYVLNSHFTFIYLFKKKSTYEKRVEIRI